jgi:hypothetical protein
VGRVGVVSMRTILEVMAFSLLGCVVVSPDAAGKGD